MAICFANWFLAMLLLLGMLHAIVLVARGDDRESMSRLSTEKLSQIVSDKNQDRTARWHATLELAKRKEPPTKGLLIRLLGDEYQSVRGAASWGLCQIGGEDAQDALLAYLRTSIESEDFSDLTRATEAQRELPDKRARHLLIKALDVGKKGSRYHHKMYAAEALGKIGDSSASLPLARQLDLSIDYTESWDYIFLESVKRTKGKDVTAILVDYLDRLVLKMKGQELKDDRGPARGREDRQIAYNFGMYQRTVSTLEAVTGRKSDRGSREEVARGWKKWWNGSKIW